MIDFSKTYCDLHPNEIISNFCCRDECFVGLCATCICSHTESHIQKKTAPMYENIRTTYSKMHEAIRNRISALENERSRINNVSEVIQGKRQQIVQIIQQTRKETLEAVNQFFDLKEKQFMRKMEADQKKLGLHNENRMDSLNNAISRDINNLFAAGQQLSSQNFLESYQRIRTHIITNSLESQKEISREMDRNENYETNVLINQNYINEVKIALEKSLTVVFGEKKGQDFTASRVLEKPEEKKEAPIQSHRSSRLLINNTNQQSQTQIQPQVKPQRRQSDSMPKMIYNPSQTRFPSNIINYAPVMMKPAENNLHASQNFQQKSQPQPQNQAQHQVQHQVQPQFQPQPQKMMVKRPSQPTLNQSTLNQSTHLANMSMISPQAQNSRIEYRPISSQKNLKEPSKYAANFKISENDNPTSPFSQPTNDNIKKVRKSGLKILKNVQNEKKV